MSTNIKIFKLVSGEEIIGNLESVEESSFKVSKPMVFYTSTMLDHRGLPYDITILKDWMARSEEKVADIPKQQVSISFSPNEKTIELYSLELTKDQSKEEIVPGSSIFGSNSDVKMDIFTEIFDDFIENVSNLMDDNGDSDYPPPLPPLPSPKSRKKKKKKQPKLPPVNELDISNFIPDELKQRPMIYLSMVIPPEALMNLMTAGVLDPDQLLAMIEEVKKKNKFTGDEKKREDFGSKFSDWNPDPKSDDYN